jgi:hypothetical protein
MSFCLFYKIREHEGKQVMSGEGRLVPMGEGGCGEMVKRGEYGTNAIYTYV